MIRSRMDALREMLPFLDRRPVLSRVTLESYGGEFYRFEGEEWCDTVSGSYVRIGPDQWATQEFWLAMAQPGMNIGDVESLESSDSVSTEGCGFESHWQVIPA